MPSSIPMGDLLTNLEYQTHGSTLSRHRWRWAHRWKGVKDLKHTKSPFHGHRFRWRADGQDSLTLFPLSSASFPATATPSRVDCLVEVKSGKGRRFLLPHSPDSLDRGAQCDLRRAFPGRASLQGLGTSKVLVEIQARLSDWSSG